MSTNSFGEQNRVWRTVSAVRTRPEVAPARKHLPHCAQAAYLCTMSPWEERNSPKDVSLCLLLNLTGLDLLNLHFPLLDMLNALSPKHTSVKAKHSLLGEGRLANYPLRCSQPWLAKAAPEAFDTNLLWQSICAVSRSSLQGNASSPAGQVLGEGATSAAMSSEGLPPSGK